MGTQNRKAVEWDHETVFHDPSDYFKSLETDLTHAQTTIDIETYILANDKTGHKILETLAKCAQRGVKVRLLLDGFGSYKWDVENIKKYQNLGIQIKFFHPLPWQRLHFSIFKYLNVRSFLRGLYKLNSRNHRKVCIIDQKIVYAGGINITAESLRDTGIRILGKEVKFVSNAFHQAWKKWDALSFYTIKSAQNDLVKLNDTRKLRKKNYYDLIQRIILSEKRIWLITPYLAPDLALIRALRFAAWSGRDVRMILPHKNDVFMMKWMNHAFYTVLLEAGVKIYEYQSKTLHAKTTLIDHWGTVGSANLNHRSLIHDLEIDIVLTQEYSIKNIEKQFENDFKLCHLIELTAWRKRSIWNRFLEKMILIMRQWV